MLGYPGQNCIIGLTTRIRESQEPFPAEVRGRGDHRIIGAQQMEAPLPSSLVTIFSEFCV